MIRRLALLLTLAGCTEHIQLARDPLNGLVSLKITPADTSIVITDLSEPFQEVDYKATGKFLDGTSHDVTDLVTFRVDNPMPGDFVDGNAFVTTNQAAGHIIVHADGDSISATATLTVIVNATVIDPSFPPPAPEIFGQPGTPVITGDPTHSPAMLYPSAGARFPQGVASTLFQLTPGAGNDTFLLSFDCELLHLGVLTGGDRWLAVDQTQRLLAQSCLTEDLAVTLEGASSSDGTIYGAAPTPIAFSPDRPDGIIYYWSAATSGIHLGELGAESAAKLYPGDTTCVGCHSAARDGSALAMGYGGETLQTIALPSLATKIDAAKKIPMGWAAFSPDGSRVVVANKGVLTLYDAATGVPVGPGMGKVTLPPMKFATHPDWSPDGAYVAVALTGMMPDNMDVDVASIARIPFHADAWGMPQVLVASAGPGDNNYFPRYSPDGTYLAYVHAAETSHGAPSAELRLVPAGGGAVISLAIASHRVGSVDGVGGIGDTMPTWAPVKGDRAWLAFSSSRAYGAVLPNAGRGQIWITAVDLARALVSGDPSSAAFWLPCQDVTVLNNNPVWSSPPATP
jgi:hypothetical protein